MERKFLFLFTIQFFFFQNIRAENTTSDSLNASSFSSGKFHINSFFASSYNSSRNWKEKYYSGIYFAGQLNMILRSNSKKQKNIFELRSELGYCKFFDSTWIKIKDNIFLSNIYSIQSGKRIEFSNLISLKTQMTDTWDSPNNFGDRTWQSGPLIPAILIVSFGTNISLNKNSYINISPAAVKINTVSTSKIISDELNYFAHTDKVLFYSEYGFNFQSNIGIKLGKLIEFENKTLLFTKKLRIKTMNLDMQNIISIKPFKLLKLQFESRMIYDELVSEKIQYRFETLLGVTLGN